MAGRREGGNRKLKVPDFRTELKPSLSSASYPLLALSDADSAGSPHSTNTSLLCFFSGEGGYFSDAVHKIQNGHMASLTLQTVDTSPLSSILKSAFLLSKLFKALKEMGLIYIHVPTNFLFLSSTLYLNI